MQRLTGVVLFALLLRFAFASNCTSTYTQAAGCRVRLSGTAELLPDSAEARVEAFRARQLELQEEERLARHNMRRRACELSAPFIEKGIALAHEAIGVGRNIMAYPLPISESAIPALRDHLPEGYHAHVERWEDVQSLIFRHVVTPDYPLYVRNNYYNTGTTAESHDYHQLINDIQTSIPEKYRGAMDDPVYFFTLYWDCTEEEFSRRRMDAWVRHVPVGNTDKVSCFQYNRCKGRKWVSSHRDWSWNKVAGYWKYYDGDWPPHPRDL